MNRKLFGILALLAFGFTVACGEGNVQKTGPDAAPPVDEAPESQESVDARYNALLETDPGIHQLPWVEIHDIPRPIAEDLHIVENPDAVARATSPWTVTATGAAAEYLSLNRLRRGDILFGETCQTCVGDAGFSLTVTGYDYSDGKAVFEVKPFRLQHAVYGEWSDEITLTPDGMIVDSEGLRTARQGVEGEDETSLSNLGFMGGVTVSGSAGVSFDPTANFSGAFRVKAGPFDRTWAGDIDNCEGHVIDEKKDIGNRFFTAATIWICVESFELSLTTNAFAEANFGLELEASYPFVEKERVFLDRNLGSIPLGSTPLAINVGIEGKVTASVEASGKVSFDATARADVSVPVGVRTRNGNIEPFVEVNNSRSVTLDSDAEASVEAKAEVSLALDASVGINRIDNVKFGNLEAGVKVTASARAMTQAEDERDACLVADIVLSPYLSAALEASVMAAGHGFSLSFWEGTLNVGQRKLIDLALPDTCPGTVKDLNDQFDIDYGAICTSQGGGGGSSSMGNLDRFLSMTCSSSEDATPACDDEQPSEECRGTMRHFFRPFFTAEGTCMGTVARDDSYTMEWSTGEKIEASAPVIVNTVTFQSTRQFDLFSSNEYNNELISEAPSDIYGPSAGVDCLNEVTYTLDELPDFLDTTTGEYESTFKPGDRLHICVKELGAMDVTCPNGEVAAIPASQAEVSKSISACLYGSPCRFSGE